ncbi:MAG: hypothetical protein HWE26_13340 [Alteromonadaceae bacterium]|nr:hypothetical protein [Alteromonadaceae bacterium]
MTKIVTIKVERTILTATATATTAIPPILAMLVVEAVPKQAASAKLMAGLD